MNGLTIIEHGGQRVLTTRQLAESYGATEKQLNDNFNNNKEHYKEGKHYYLLKGEELESFKNQPEIFGVVKKGTSQLYLWTERGALLHAKSLGTEVAWEVYERLLDVYFYVKEGRIPPTIPDPMKLFLSANNAQHEVQQLKPKADGYDRFISTEGLMDASDAANLINKPGLGRNNLLKFMREQKLVNNVNKPYQEYMNKGYFIRRWVTVPSTGNTYPKTYLTKKGFEYIVKLIDKKLEEEN